MSLQYQILKCTDGFGTSYALQVQCSDGKFYIDQSRMPFNTLEAAREHIRKLSVPYSEEVVS